MARTTRRLENAWVSVKIIFKEGITRCTAHFLRLYSVENELRYWLRTEDLRRGAIERTVDKNTPVSTTCENG